MSGLLFYAPIALIVVSNIFYHLSSKATPTEISPFASLTVTYLIGAVVSVALFFVFSPDKNILNQYRHLHWSSVVLGLAVVGLEVGSITMYKVGWPLGIGQLVHSSILAICLIVIGYFVFHEALSAQKLLGVAVCLFGLFLINR